MLLAKLLDVVLVSADGLLCGVVLHREGLLKPERDDLDCLPGEIGKIFFKNHFLPVLDDICPTHCPYLELFV